MTSIGNYLPQEQFNSHSSQADVYKGLIKKELAITYQKQRSELRLGKEDIKRRFKFSTDGAQENIESRITYFPDINRDIFLYSDILTKYGILNHFRLKIPFSHLREISIIFVGHTKPELKPKESPVEPQVKGVSVKIIKKDGKEYFHLPDGREIRTSTSPYSNQTFKEKMRRGLEVYWGQKDELEKKHYGKLAIIREDCIKVIEKYDELIDEIKKPHLTILRIGTLTVGLRRR